MLNINLPYRYPGVKPFTDEERDIFFGRDFEIDSLSRFIVQNRLVVLYARSGMGKSSLVNAGIIPKLRSEGEYRPFNIRLGAYQEQRGNDILGLVKHFLPIPEGDCYIDSILPDDESLWRHFKSYQAKVPGNSDFVLFFDQFEELFTYPEKSIEAFHYGLGTLLNSDIPQVYRDYIEKYPDTLSDEETKLLYEPLNIRVVLSIRSDRLSELDRLSNKLPDILDNRYHLRALDRQQAQDAILDPAFLPQNKYGFISHKFNYTDKAVEHLLDYLSQNGEKRIESFQLQVICQYAENLILSAKKNEIDIADLGDLRKIFEKHYDRQINQLKDKEEQLLARKLIEEGLIFEEAERRITLYDGIISQDYGVGEILLRKLVNTHLLRAEPDPRGGFLYELSHDTLVEPVLIAKRRRLAQEAEKRQIEQINKQAAELSVERKKRRQARFIAIGGLTLALVSIVALFFAVNSNRKAQKAEARAQGQLHISKANLIYLEKDNADLALVQIDSAANLFPDKKESVYAYLNAIEVPQVWPHRYLTYFDKAKKIGAAEDSLDTIVNQYFELFLEKQKYGLAAKLAEWKNEIGFSPINCLQYYERASEFGAFEAAYHFLKAQQLYANNTADISALGNSVLAKIGDRPWPLTEGKIRALAGLENAANDKANFPVMLPIEGGIFRMGSSNGEPNARPVHRVRVSSFEMSKYEISAGQYVSFLNATKLSPDSTAAWINFGHQIIYEDGVYKWVNGEEGFPVYYVTWVGAKAYARWLSDTLKQHYEIPTEAEWEYAAGKNDKGEILHYSGSRDPKQVAWFEWNSESVLHPVGMLQPNDFGIYDMSGNVWEWTYDWYDDGYYGQLAEANPISINPFGPPRGEFVTRRGGSYLNKDTVRIRKREIYYGDNYDNIIGFRVVRILDESSRPTD
ncbi:MAG: SUMF1/EgtB/PvdO family nonheme iron enzyme [Bacteroidota bacterium]